MRSLWIWLACGLPAAALIFRDGPSPAANTGRAPTGAYAESGWHYQIRYKSFHGTMISPKHFITARHVGGAETEVTQPVIFNGVEERTYTIKPESRIIIGTTDLAVFEIWETFENYAPLYTKVNEMGQGMVIFGRGVGRGSELVGQGWKWGPEASRESRWGRNTIDGVVTSGGNDLLFFGFHDLVGQDEVAATSGDSGGGWFVKDGSTWKLAAVSFTVDSSYSEAAAPSDMNDFRGSFYDAGNLSIGSDQSGWDLVPTNGSSSHPSDDEFYRQSHTYGSRISSHISEIESVISPGLALAGLTPVERFENWLGAAGGPSLMGEGDDADGDGVTNLGEYLTESDPSDQSEAVRPLGFELLPDGGHQFTLVESLDFAGRGLTTILQSSPDLAAWSAVSDASEISSQLDNAKGTRTRILTRSHPEVGKLYYRLKIALRSP